MQKHILSLLFFFILIFTITYPLAFAQPSGELVDIDYPPSLDPGAEFTVTMTVKNTGTSTWTNVCVSIWHRSFDGEDSILEGNTCNSLGNLEPGAVQTFTCDSGGGIPETTEKIFAKVGTPFGWEDCRSIVQVELDITVGGILATTTIPNTTTTANVQKCLVEELYGFYSEKTALLRCVRDNLLRKTPEGQEIIELYYQWSPYIVKAMESNETLREEIKTLIDAFFLLIKAE